jgi:hypothetical protein
VGAAEHGRRQGIVEVPPRKEKDMTETTEVEGRPRTHVLNEHAAAELGACPACGAEMNQACEGFGGVPCRDRVSPLRQPGRRPVLVVNWLDEFEEAMAA